MINLVCEVPPRISVIMPINRDDGFFEHALNSVLNQSFKDFELIVIGNNCDDALWDRISKIEDNRIFSKRTDLGGATFAMNLGLSMSRGEYIARMDSDDLCMPNRLKLQLTYMDNNSNVDIIGGRVRLINSYGQELNESITFYETHEEIISTLPYRNPLVHSAVLFRKKIIIENGGYKFSFIGEDYELWIRLMLAGKVFHNLKEEILLYRRHEGQSTSDNQKKIIFDEVSAMLFMYFLKTKDVRFLAGIFTKIPLIRRIKKFLVGL